MMLKHDRFLGPFKRDGVFWIFRYSGKEIEAYKATNPEGQWTKTEAPQELRGEFGPAGDIAIELTSSGKFILAWAPATPEVRSCTTT